MDSYLSIAQRVLEQERKPMSARQMLDAAYRMRVVPDHLFGKTQHKTLHARIAEDILLRRVRSAFVRTEPGRFMLRRLLSDSTLPESYKREFPAPRRAEQLRNFPVLSVRRPQIPNGEFVRSTDKYGLTEEIASWKPEYRILADIWDDHDFLFFRAFTIVVKGSEILTHESVGRTLDDLPAEKSLGFFTYLTETDLSLFSADSFGIDEACRRALAEQIQASDDLIEEAEQSNSINYWGWFTIQDGKYRPNAVYIIMSYTCPERFDPVRRLGRHGGVRWESCLLHLNTYDGFEKRSQRLIRTGILNRIIDHESSKAPNIKG
ncbi:HTH domain-containing protein [Mesorhizobium atlanticum]|uniref:HTH domain-containing protein n=1 Tax=Mesorhizobium atlanticum TaxID=2233532 RepID=UPI0015EB80FE|nr:HTH domain-containing protein [Mesorhizobium atlanticum]